MASVDAFEQAHRRHLMAVQRQVAALFTTAADEAARIGVRLDAPAEGRMFSFGDYPRTREAVDALLGRLSSGLEAVTANGIRDAWDMANGHNDGLCRRVFGDDWAKVPEAVRRRYLNNNASALDAFLRRKEAGLSLSDRVWRYTDQCKGEIEMALGEGLGRGRDAAALSRDVRRYFQNPDALFRRVRDKYGNLQLSKAAAAYHPGRGVYRSAYKNALRMTGTETNMAYRTADHLRWQQLDFVVGIEIRTSGNHPLEDICDELAGRYPKTFKFTGWHPQCRCHAVPVLKTEQEMARDTGRILDGQEPLPDSANAVASLPPAFTGWLADNEQRIATASTLPYFISDNHILIDRRLAHGRNSKGVANGLRLGRRAQKDAQNAVLASRKISKFSPEQVDNFRVIETALDVKRGNSMSFEEADHGLANTAKDRANCVGCVIVHEMRLRGFNITALPYSDVDGSPQSTLASDTLLGWLTKKNKKPKFSNRIIENAPNFEKLVNEATSAIGSRYTMEWDAVGECAGHIIFAERTPKGLYLYDPQGNCFWGIMEIQKAIKKGSTLNILRIDRLLLNPEKIRGLFVSLNR